MTDKTEPDMTPAERRFDTIYRDLRRKIVLLDYGPGDKLDLAELEQHYDVSRTPLRRVLQKLCDDGLVRARHGVPTTVRPVDLDQLRPAFLFRMGLAEQIGALDPCPPSPEALNRLRAFLDRGAFGDLDARSFGEIDLEVHEIICTLIGNPWLHVTYDRMFHITARLWQLHLDDLNIAREAAAFEEDCRAIFEALNRGDVAAIGYIIRNALSGMLFRLHGVI
ncbi:GntR family transcriptional regulator [Paracoccaceae bacterium GXU_MW_L88]